MLIHGAWLSSRSWDPFAEYFRERGYDVSAPEWPRKQGDVEELREATDAIEGLGLTEIVDHYEAQIRALDREPILIGHSFGGLIVELLLDRGLARGGVAMSPAPPKGILVLPFSTLKVVSTALAHKSRWHGVVPLTLEEAVQEVREVPGTDRLPGVRRPASPDDGRREMGRDRRGDRRLDRRRAREDGCRGAQRRNHGEERSRRDDRESPLDRRIGVGG